jgi:uncharacterized protein (TIGR02001 family)
MLCACFASASADETQAPPHQFSGTATLVSDYIFRGLTQTWGKPALQGSIDYAHSSGAYASLWASSISNKVVAGAHTEIDLAVGYKGAFDHDWTYSGGVLSIFYPGGNYNKIAYAALPGQKYDFTELNASLGYRWVSVKYSYSINDLLGFNEKTGFTGGTRGSGYVELNADLPLMESGYVLSLHAGHQDIRARYADGRNPDFTDYRIALGRQFESGWAGAVQVTQNANSSFFDNTPSNYNLKDMRDVGKRRFAISVTRLF